jgi:hypothetical protein
MDFEIAYWNIEGGESAETFNGVLGYADFLFCFAECSCPKIAVLGFVFATREADLPAVAISMFLDALDEHEVPAGGWRARVEQRHDTSFASVTRSGRVSRPAHMCHLVLGLRPRKRLLQLGTEVVNECWFLHEPSSKLLVLIC